MRIAYVCADPGIPVFGTKGASVHIQDVVRELVRRGHQVEIHAVRMGDRVPADLADVPTVAYPLDTAATGDRERAQATASRMIASRLWDNPPDLVWERYSLFSTALGSLWEAFGVPGILEVNAPLIEEQREHRSLVDEAGARRALSSQVEAARAVVCVSDPVRDWVVDMTGTERAHTVPNGVDTRRIRPVGQDPDAVVVTFVGTLKPWHGVENVIEARRLAGVPWSLRIIGDGPQRAALEEACRDAGVEADFRGAVAPHEIPAQLEGTAIAVAPYPAPEREDQHYFSPLKVYEYMAAGLPVVASALGQIPVALLGCGILVPPSDAGALARAIDSLAKDPGKRADLGAQARRCAEERHSWESAVGRILSLVEGSDG